LTRIEYVFESSGEDELPEAMRDAQRDERSAVARRLFAVGHYAMRRLAELGDDRANWCVDDWEAVAAEVGCHLGLSRGRASSQMREGTALIERLPRLGAALAAGEVDYRVVAAAITRTALVIDRDVLAEIDAELAEAAPTWNTLSRKKVTALVDWLVVERDPEAVRVARQSDADRHIEVEPGDHGTADIYGSVRAPDAAAFDKRLTELAATVCADDPRTIRQRRADALAAVTAGASTMPCLCGRDGCPAGEAPDAQPPVVIYVLAEASALDGTTERPAYVPGYGTLPAEAVRDLAGRAKLQPIVQPPGGPSSSAPQTRGRAPPRRVVRLRGIRRQAPPRWAMRTPARRSAGTDHRKPCGTSFAPAISRAGFRTATVRRSSPTSTTRCRIRRGRHTRQPQAAVPFSSSAQDLLRRLAGSSAGRRHRGVDGAERPDVLDDARRQPVLPATGGAHR
jgi:hypothetical protein